MQDVFKIKTVNYSYGEVYVNAPLDRESVDRYLLKVRSQTAELMTTRRCFYAFETLSQSTLRPQLSINTNTI